RDLAPTERVGFDTLADQYVNRQQQLGFRFNLLCVGETAIGKASLLDSLFDQAFKLPSHDHQEPNVSVETTETKVEEGGTEILLRLSTTVGYGDQISRAATIEPIVEFLDKQFEAHFQEEIKTQRDLAQHEDTRVHACLFMLAPTGHTLKSLDLEVLRALHEKVNVIPVIAKADTLSPDELANFKHTLRQEFQANNIRTFDFDIGSQVSSALAVPLGVVGSKDVVTVGGISSRVRQYPWGVVEVENEQHSDFMKLRRLLFQTCMETLRHKTHMVHYEKYRHDKLGALGLGGSAGDDENQPSTCVGRWWPTSTGCWWPVPCLVHGLFMLASGRIADAVIAAKKQMEAELKLLEQSKMDRLKSEVRLGPC
ncbi:uncharacterized protein MONBRDRAFT_16664, partial [Monosiga brevicollis MX1]